MMKLISIGLLTLSAPARALALAHDAGSVSTAPSRALEHRVLAGDTLWTLAGTFYQSSFLWQRIAEANPPLACAKDGSCGGDYAIQGIKDPHWIYPGQILQIPPAPAPELRPAESGLTQEDLAVKPEPERPAVSQLEHDPQLEPEAAPPPARPQASRKELKAEVSPDQLSMDMPPTMTGYYFGWPSTRVPRSWREDGRVEAREGVVVLAQAGDKIYASLNTARPGERFAVYKLSTRKEGEAQSDGFFLQQTALIEALAPDSDGSIGFRVLRADGAVEPGDLIKRESE